MRRLGGFLKKTVRGSVCRPDLGYCKLARACCMRQQMLVYYERRALRKLAALAFVLCHAAAQRPAFCCFAALLLQSAEPQRSLRYRMPLTCPFPVPSEPNCER